MATRYPVSDVLRALRGGLDENLPDVVPPIHVSVPYRFTGAYTRPIEEVKYARENNPTTMLFENACRVAEGAKWCLAFNTGMAAIAAALEALSETGAARIVASKLLYGTTRTLLGRLAGRGFNVHYAGPPWSELVAAIEKLKPEIVLVETIGNPTLRVPPLDILAKLCNEIGCTLLLDNTFASPYLYRPLAESQSNIIVVESVTKYIGGHNDVMGGIVCGDDEDLYERTWSIRKTLGTIMQPLDAFLAARGLKTLHVRMEYSSKTAMKIAEALRDNSEVREVHYPGLVNHKDHATASKLFTGLYGAVLSFDVGGERLAKEVLRGLRLIVPSPSLGGTESIIAYPFESSHRGLSDEEKEKLGITRGLLRLSVGLEDAHDILDDILSALSRAKGREA